MYVGTLKRLFDLSTFHPISLGKTLLLLSLSLSATSFGGVPCADALKSGVQAVAFFSSKKSPISVEKVVDAWVEKNASEEYPWEPEALENPKAKYRALAIGLKKEADPEKQKKKEIATLNFLLDLKDRSLESSASYQVIQHPHTIELIVSRFLDPLPVDFDYTSAVVQAAASIYWPMVAGVAIVAHNAYRFYWQTQVDPQVLRDLRQISLAKLALPENEVVAVRVQSDKAESAFALLYAPPIEVLNREPSRLSRAWDKWKKIFGMRARRPPQNVLTLISLSARGIDDSEPRLSLQTPIP